MGALLLADAAQGRDNNLNLIRALAACAVLISHAYPIALGPEAAQPLKALTGYTLGTIAVFAFFVISGFLIAQSFERTRSRKRFVQARFLRLWPGLIVSIVLVAVLLGPLVSTLPVGRYFADPGVWSFMLRNLTLVSVQYTLPGVFETQPYTTVEGSIWTLIYEALFYVGVFVLGVLSLLGRPRAMALIFAAYLALFFAVQVSGVSLPGKAANLLALALPFAVGTGFYIWRSVVPLSLLLAVGLAGLAWLAHDTALYAPIFTIALGYAVFWAAYVPGGVLRLYNRLGDYSYGIYIYAFPLQGFVIWLWGPMSPEMNILLSLPLVLIPSILSWHLIEKPSLALRRRSPTDRTSVRDTGTDSRHICHSAER